MGLCPRDYMSGFSHCKYEVMDENFEVSLLDYLQHQLRYKNYEKGSSNN